ncbi:serine O-acetyltransferase EpsC [Streptomyces sp. NPDC005009]
MFLEDLRTACRKDPALHGARVVEVLLYPGLWAIWAHRLTHRLHRWGLPLLPRALSQLSRALTGIEIHPGAVIGRRCFIDHGMGVVIGETAVLGDDVMLYHRVTLGGTGWWTDAPAARRHPTIGDRVVLGVGASVLGPVRVGHDTLVGAHALVLRDVPAHSCVRAASTHHSTAPDTAPSPAPHTKERHVRDTPVDHRAHRPHSPGGPAPLR